MEGSTDIVQKKNGSRNRLIVAGTVRGKGGGHRHRGATTYAGQLIDTTHV